MSNLEKFVRRAIKNSSEQLDESELQELLDLMTTSELQDFWIHFTANRAFSATTSVPYWKTKQQETILVGEIANYAFYPKEKDASGKYIVVRDELIQHIKAHLIKYINQDKRRN